ncbi:hypothetical protein CHLNCDRAFT_32470 [Chlorella variabilis]|uniref:Photosystem I reaction center subunit N, chloroplastic n=1 Tax=Chlorella variabilis TaxID=554065 RepID=E1ZNL6_CHLVA|nr:hypothetical protein CHLNCDRAFT_32470 [Chlorella variabilis]EFN52626.1 hypothetical protein CHLNCDRAFT_32470 [Chlorella variabilis]|eukprot:XP_005844728.1 hypothetical protein CHLNCDRAFT_32470 [Chlorella variabilis]
MMSSTLAGAKLQCRAPAQQRRAQPAVVVAAADNRAAAGFAAAALAAAVLINAPMAKADLTSDLMAKSSENKALHDKQRLATSYSNFARSRTVSDGTCKFPGNWFGCDIGAVAGDVKFVADDIKLECTGKEAGKCASNMNILNKRQ